MNILEFKNVSFQYYSDQPEVLSDVSLVLEKGKSYAFVGPTGQGKSTTASLMARLYNPTKGQVLFKDKDLQDWAEAELYQEIGFILQDPYLFSGTVLENIVYGNILFKDYSLIYDDDGNIDKEELVKFTDILTAKKLLKLIEVFPEGLSTKVTNNSENISLGQKQIINFLRIILREPSFLILDEATANLDTITENLLQEILDALPKDTTKMIIAHRLNTIKNVDQVFLVGGGKVSRNG